MKNKWFQKVVCMILSVTVLLGALGFSTSAASLKADPTEEHPYDVPSLEDMQSLVGTLAYAEYIANFAGVPAGPYTLTVPDITNPLTKTNAEILAAALSEHVQRAKNEDASAWVNFGQENYDETVYLPSTGSATWALDVSESEAGLYYLKIEYYSCYTDESSVSPIERGLLIDGKVPFGEVASIALNKTWAYDNVVVSDPVPVTDGREDGYYDVDYTWSAQLGTYVKTVISVKDGMEHKTTYTLTQDIIGNSMSPGSSSFQQWNTYYVQDGSGYHSGYFAFYLADGTHTITLEAERDPVIIKSIEFVPAVETASTLTYEEYLAQHANKKNDTDGETPSIKIEAEFPDMVSDSSVAPSNDNTSAINSPVNAGDQLYNVIGETGFSTVGQWAAYKFQVTKSGFYNFGMRFKQNTLQGMFVCRTLKLAGGEYGLADGTPTVPFAEANNARFGYVDGWQSTFISDGENAPFELYFEEGVEYTLYLECSLGSLKKYIQVAEDALNAVNSAYLRIIQLTGTDPDEYNDSYDFMAIMPDALISILEHAVALENAHKELMEICGTNGAHIAQLETIYKLFNTVGSDKGRNIAANLSTLKSYLGTLGTWINTSKGGVVMVDSIHVVPMLENEEGERVNNTAELPAAEAGFFASIWFEIKAFFASFFTDYDLMGVTSTVKDEELEHIDVWISAGRDQSQIWRTMIDAEGGFTDKTGVSVSLKLVAGGTLLPSILSRKGPDVYMGLGSAEVINYAIREAVLGVSGNDPVLDAQNDKFNPIFTTPYYTYVTVDPTTGDKNYETTTEYDATKTLSFATKPFETVIDGNFAKAAMDTVTLGGVSYGIPRTMQFAMMFYRMDVLANIGREVPESWDDLLSILPLLQSNNMQIGVAHIAALDFMIYQKGGSFWKYTDESLYDPQYAGARVDLDSDIALEAFDFTCRLYSDYSFPVSYDAANRFRTGEMPIIIGSYADVYNQLIIYATEISGLWRFCSLPGSFRDVEEEDGTVTTKLVYDSLAQVTATIILNGCEDRDNLLPAWQFVQWETDAEQSAEYGNRIVAIIGPSAKYETANLNALENLSWTASEKAAIMNQMDHMSSIVNFPGSYIIGRYLQFAFLDAVNEGANAVDALTSYMGAINEEIWRKREEFGLWTPKVSDEEPPQLTSAVFN